MILNINKAEKIAVIEKYRRQILEETQYVNLQGIPLPKDRTGCQVMLNLPLTKVYIQVQAIKKEEKEKQEQFENARLSKEINTSDYLAKIAMLGEYFYRQGQAYKAEERPQPVDPIEAIKKHSRIAILGAPGAGKSTLLRYITHQMALDSGKIPILITARSIAELEKGQTGLSNFILKKCCSRLYNSTPQEQILLETLLVELINDRIEPKIVWLIDALDEAGEKAAEVAGLVNTLPGSLVITSRPMGYQLTKTSNTLAHFELLPLTPQNMDQFINDWFTALAAFDNHDQSWIDERTNLLKTQLAARPPIQRLTQKPLLLTFLIILSGREQPTELPTQKAELYWKYLEGLIANWEIKDLDEDVVKVLGALPLDSIRELYLLGLERIGWYLHAVYYSGKKGKPNTKETTHNLADYLVADPLFKELGANNLNQHTAELIAKAIITFWHQKAQLLDYWELNKDDCYYTFRHLTFQEYSVAHVLKDSWTKNFAKTWKFLRPRLHHYAWREPILLLAELLDGKQRSRLIKKVLTNSSVHESLLHRDLFFAATILDEVNMKPLVNQRLSKKMVGLLVKKFNNRCKAISATARDLIGRIGSTEAVPALINALSDSNSDVRKNAAWALGKIGSPEAVLALINALSDSSGVCRSAVEALREISSPKTLLPVLINALSDNEWSVRKNAVKALEKIGSPEVVPVLINALSDNDWSVRKDVVGALGIIGSPEAVPALSNALSDSNSDIRKTAAWALERISASKKSAEVVSALIKVFRDNEPETLAVVIKALRNNGSIRENEVESLVKIGNPEAVVVAGALIEALRDNEPKTLPVLIKALSDNEKNVRESAAEALGEIGSTEAVPDLIKALSDNEEDVRDSAVEALRSIINKSHLTCQVKRVVNILRRKFQLQRTDEYLSVLNSAVDRLNSLTVLELPYSDLLSAGSPKARIISYILNIVLLIVIIIVIIYLAKNQTTPIAYFILAVFAVIGFIANLPVISEIVKKQFNKTRI
jgi:HEAT repeat protein/energy-coupling factor transporter ATP-binding protein EcfA2